MPRYLISALLVSVLSCLDASGQTGGGTAQTGGSSQTQGTTSQTQGTAATQTLPVPVFVNLSKVSNDYQVGAGDLLEIQVVGHAELTQTLRISNSGEVSFPMVGLIRVADLTAFEVEETIGSRLRSAGLVQQPEVLVFVREYQAKPIYVSGAVASPGEFIMSQELTVADAVLLAGGLMFNASTEGLLYRRTTPEARSLPPAALAETGAAGRSGVEIVRVDLQPLKEGRFYQAALPLRRGDVLVVPEMRMNPFYVVGEVIDPRNFFYPPGRPLTASQAISWAGGPTSTAKLSDGMLVRYDEQGNRQEIKVDYAAILRGKQNDFPIQPNDIIFVPGSKVKTIGHGMLLLTDSMVASASFRIARTYQLPEAPDRANREPN